MHVLIATDGTLDPTDVTPFASALAGDEGRVTIITVLEISRRQLHEVRAAFGEEQPASVGTDVEYVGAKGGTGAEAHGWPGDDTIMERLLEGHRDERCTPLAEALRAAGVEVTVEGREGEDPAAVVIEAVSELGADVVIAGSQGKGVFQSLLGATGTKLMRHSPKPVLLIRA